jgi:pimeloyl-ACP methyl ester carboxylesterase
MAILTRILEHPYDSRASRRGAGGGAQEWRTAMAQILYLHGSGHTSAAFDGQTSAVPGSESLALPGHPAGEALASVAELSAWLAGEVSRRASGPAVICGNSLGAAVALQTALTYPGEVAGMILIGGGARLRVGNQIFDMIDQRWPACIDELVGYSVDEQCPQPLRRRLHEMHVIVGQRATRMDYAACNEFDVMDRVGTIATPALILVGAHDRMTPPKYAEFLHGAIAGSELAVIDGAGHVPHLEQPSAVNDAILRWSRDHRS